jgi:exonuclease SbcD
MDLVRILFLADTHLGFDSSFRPRIERRRRGPDFFRNFDRALEPARRGEVDLVVHGGDILYRSKVPPELVQMAFAPLKRLADDNVPVYVVPGNHERSGIPYRLLAEHPNIHTFDRPRTFRYEKDGFVLALANADAHVLCVHQAVEGATVGPGDYVFRDHKDTVRASDIPTGLAAVLAGHIHRHQVLRRDLSGTPLPAPVLYPGSIERTSFAEKNERKGYLILDLETEGARRGRLYNWDFHELPTRPMFRIELDPRRMGHDWRPVLKETLERLPANAVVSLRVRGAWGRSRSEALSAPSIRSIAPPTMNVSLVFETPGAGSGDRMDR